MSATMSATKSSRALYFNPYIEQLLRTFEVLVLKSLTIGVSCVDPSRPHTQKISNGEECLTLTLVKLLQMSKCDLKSVHV